MQLQPALTLFHALSGLCSAIAGILFSFYSLSGYSLAAQGKELDAIAAVVIDGTLVTGGTGYVVGVLVLGIVQTFIADDGTLSSCGTKIVIGGTLLTGGTGYVLGSVVGILVLGIVQTFIADDGTLSSWWTKIVIGGLLLVFILLQRLFARKAS